MPKTIDLAGQTFGRLTVIELHPQRCGDGSVRWICECTCGTVKAIRSSHLRNGTTRSCGCLIREIASDPDGPLGRTRYKHGHAVNGQRTPEYECWVDMKQRCSNPGIGRSYTGWGGRGIAVCARWLESFSNFLADMGPRPGPEYSIDRINNDGNYEPGNCRWATPYEQVHNRRPETHCRRGLHLFDEANTYIDPNTGGRRCRQCMRDWEKAHRR